MARGRGPLVTAEGLPPGRGADACRSPESVGEAELAAKPVIAAIAPTRSELARVGHESRPPQWLRGRKCAQTMSQGEARRAAEVLGASATERTVSPGEIVCSPSTPLSRTAAWPLRVWISSGTGVPRGRHDQLPSRVSPDPSTGPRRSGRNSEKAFLQRMHLRRSSPAAAQLAEDLQVGALAAELEAAIRLYLDQALVKEPYGAPTQYHRDTPWWSFSSPTRAPSGSPWTTRRWRTAACTSSLAAITSGSRRSAIWVRTSGPCSPHIPRGRCDRPRSHSRRRLFLPQRAHHPRRGREHDAGSSARHDDRVHARPRHLSTAIEMSTSSVRTTSTP